MERNFGIGEAIKFGWATTTGNFSFFLGVFGIVILAFGIPTTLSDNLSADFPELSFLFFLLSVVMGVLISLGLAGALLSFVDGQKPPLSKLFSYRRLFFNYLFAMILNNLIVFVGLLLFIVPGIIWAIKFQFYSYAIVDRGLGSLAALKESSSITKGIKIKLLLFLLAILGINFLGLLALGVGLLLTIPTAMLATAYVYRKLMTQTESAQLPAVPQTAPPPPVLPSV